MVAIYSKVCKWVTVSDGGYLIRLTITTIYYLCVSFVVYFKYMQIIFILKKKEMKISQLINKLFHVERV